MKKIILLLQFLFLLIFFRLNNFSTAQITDPYLEVYLNLPDPYSINNIIQNSTFTVNATVYCRGGFCGNVNATVRYNLTSPFPDTPINTSEGDKPFYIQEPPYPSSATKNCSNNPLNDGDSCNISWIVNATGEIDSSWKIGVLFQSNESTVEQNHTDNATIVIINCTVDMSVLFDSIRFGEVTPGGPYNASGNSYNLYNITVNPGSCNLDIYINASDLVNSTLGSAIGVGNITFSNTTNDYTVSFKLSHEYQPIKLDVPPGINVTTWYWLNVPPVYAGIYEGIVTIKGVKVGETP